MSLTYPDPSLLKELAGEYGTPLMVYDEDAIRQTMRAYTENFRSDKFETAVLYASKAFLCTAIAGIAMEEGLHFDAVSGGEIYCLAKAGASAERIHFHGNNKTPGEIEDFFRLGHGHIIVDNEDELKLVRSIANSLKQPMDILIRLNPGVEAHTHEYIATATKDSKFGISIDKTDAIISMVNIIEACPYLTFAGFHSHIGSQILESEAFAMEIRVMFEFIGMMHDRHGIDIRDLDLGGGFAIRYTPEDNPPSTESVCRRIISLCEEEVTRRNLPLKRLMIEPGRSIVGDSGYTLYTAGCRKSTDSREYVFIDGGMADNIRPALYEAEYTCRNITRNDEAPDRTYTLAGKCCESGDILIKEARLPETFPGDLLLVHATGAYGYSMASNYNRLGRPPVVFINGSSHRLVLRRETYEDMMNLDVE